MSAQLRKEADSRIEEPPDSKNPDSERGRKKRRTNDTDNSDPRPRRDKPSPEIPHDPQDVPEQELRSSDGN